MAWFPSDPALQQMPGLIQDGNIDVNDRPRVPFYNPQTQRKEVATVHSGSFDLPDDLADKYGVPHGSAVLLPSVFWNPDHKSGYVETDMHKVFQHFVDTGEHLGIFKDNQTADAYSIQLHNQQAKEYNPPQWFPPQQPGPQP